MNRRIVNDTETKKPEAHYFVHYLNWAEDWDEWVAHPVMFKNSKQNRKNMQLQKIEEQRMLRKLDGYPRESMLSSDVKENILNNNKLLLNDESMSDVHFVINYNNETKEYCGIRALFGAQSIVFKLRLIILMSKSVCKKNIHFLCIVLFAGFCVLFAGFCVLFVGRKMLFGKQWKESQSNSQITIDDISFESFEMIRCYCYGIDNNITMSNCVGVYYASQKYMLDILNKKCSNYIKSNIDNNSILYLLQECQEYHLSVKFTCIFTFSCLDVFNYL